MIVTDVAGREPMVVLPLEQFEALTGDASPSNKPSPKLKANGDDASVRELEEIIAEQARARAEESVLQIQTLQAELPTDSDLTLEERFYLEPLEDKSKDG